MKIGVVLIGGSLKGIAGHTGVVAALRELNICPYVILGASAGSVIASYLSINMSDVEMYQRMIALKAKDYLDPISRVSLLSEFIFHKAKNFTGFVRGNQLQRYMELSLLTKDDFSKTDIPLYIAATNLRTREVTLFNTGTISEKIRASTAIPILFEPKHIGNEDYIDGALAKELLPKALTEAWPDLDLLIVSNFSYEHRVSTNWLQQEPLPIFEIVSNVLAIHERRSWPNRIGKTRIVYLKPAVRTPVDIFNPSPDVTKSVFEESRHYTLSHLKRTLKTFKGYK